VSHALTVSLGGRARERRPCRARGDVRIHRTDPGSWVRFWVMVVAK
jgi:hypothetical protein